MKNSNRNIILTGMPGAGKTTIGKLVAEKLNLEFCDIDDYIVEKNNATIPKLFEKGEEYFRNLETSALEEVSRVHPRVIATGGGAIKRVENIEILERNGVIIFINRPLENIVSDIDIKGRPLLADGTDRLYKLFNERYHLYKARCNYEILNDKDIDTAVNEITGIYKRESLMDDTVYN